MERKTLEDIMAEIQAAPSEGVSFLDRLVSKFVAGDESHQVIKFQESTLAILEQDIPPKWRIASYISPDIIGESIL